MSFVGLELEYGWPYENANSYASFNETGRNEILFYLNFREGEM